MKYIPLNINYAINPDNVTKISTTAKVADEITPIPGEKEANWINVTTRDGEWHSSDFMSEAGMLALRDEFITARTGDAVPCEVDGVPL